MTDAPTVTISIPLEGVPEVVISYASDADRERLRLWLDRAPDLKRMIVDAQKYARTVTPTSDILDDGL